VYEAGERALFFTVYLRPLPVVSYAALKGTMIMNDDQERMCNKLLLPTLKYTDQINYTSI
jgi:hypothetical protein